MELDRKALVSTLEKVNPALGNNLLLPLFMCYRFENNKVTVTDGTIVFIYNLPEDIGIDCLIPARPLFDLLNSISKKTIELEVKDKELNVITDTLEGSFVLSNVGDYIQMKSWEEFEEEKVPEGLVDALVNCSFAASKDRTQGCLCGVKIDEGYMYGTDKYRIMRCEMEDKKHILSGLIVPTKFISVINKFEKCIEKVGVDKERGVLYVELDKGYIYTSLMSGNFPGCAGFFEELGEMKEVVFSSDMDGAINRHLEFQRSVAAIDRDISVLVSGKSAMLLTRDPIVGVLDEEVDLKESIDDEFEFVVNPLFLKDALSKEHRFCYNPDGNVILIESGPSQYLVKTRIKVINGKN